MTRPLLIEYQQQAFNKKRDIMPNNLSMTEFKLMYLQTIKVKLIWIRLCDKHD